MAKYVVKHDSISLPRLDKDQSGRVFRKGAVVEIEDSKVAERLLGYGAIEDTAKIKESEEKSEDDKSTAPRGRGAAKPAN